MVRQAHTGVLNQTDVRYPDLSATYHDCSYCIFRMHNVCFAKSSADAATPCHSACQRLVLPIPGLSVTYHGRGNFDNARRLPQHCGEVSSAVCRW